MQHATLPSPVEQLQIQLETRPIEREPRVYLAVDANPYEVRMVTTLSDGLIMDHSTVGSHQLVKALSFVRRQRRMNPGLIITGARHDRWPPGFLPAFVLEFGPICWASQLMLQEASREVRRCTGALKFFRSTFIALCAASESARKLKPVLQQWKRSMVWEMMLDLDVLPLHDYVSTVDDIPF